jgi:predicted Rossmann fold flavoprotein
LTLKKIAIIGGGAAGFFAAVNLAEQRPDFEITIYEGSNKLLSKVLISGGGRCNVTNRISDPLDLVKNYPRGEDFLLHAFQQFSTTDTRAWFEKRGVPTKIEEDGRVFPLSNTSQSIYDCLVSLARKYNISIKTHHRLIDLERNGDQFCLHFADSKWDADAVILSTGSNAVIYTILKKWDIGISKQVPSLFTLDAKNHLQKPLAGVSVQHAEVKIKGDTSAPQYGPILITHWGYSGPAVLRLSAWKAIRLNELNYHFTLVINWLPHFTKDTLIESFRTNMNEKAKEKVASWKEHNLPKRLWQSLLEEAEIREFTNWTEIGKKGIMRLTDKLTNYEVAINKKSTFKEEFVTAGGIELNELNQTTFEIKKHPNLYAAGEILNIDAITGGFNFQAAWTGGFLIAKNLSRR